MKKFLREAAYLVVSLGIAVYFVYFSGLEWWEYMYIVFAAWLFIECVYAAALYLLGRTHAEYDVSSVEETYKRRYSRWLYRKGYESRMKEKANEQQEDLE